MDIIWGCIARDWKYCGSNTLKHLNRDFFLFSEEDFEKVGILKEKKPGILCQVPGFGIIKI